MTTEIGAFIHALIEDTTPDGTLDFVMTYDHSAGAVKKVTPVNLGAVGGGIPISGWIVAAAMTYAGADDPTYTATMVGDVSGTYGLGMRIKLTQATGGTKYFIITKIAVAGDTTLTLYGGTDYNLEAEAITDPYYALVKTPFGFPLDPTKWTVESTDVTQRSQASPATGTWYNLNGDSITIPIGVWRVSYQVDIAADRSSAAGVTQVQAALSTANNSASDADLVCEARVTADSTSYWIASWTFYREKFLALTTKTVYYLNSKAPSTADALYNLNAASKLIIRAMCAYL